MESQKPIAKGLTAVVSYGVGTSVRVKTVTHIQILAGSVPVATAVLGGRYSQPQALAEFKKNPRAFKFEEGGEALAALAA